MNTTYEAAVRRAIKRVHVEVRPNLRISRESQEALIAILCLLNDRIIGECVKNHKSKKEGLKVRVAQRAMETIYPGLLKAHANANASKCLAKYQAGLIEYHPKLVKIIKKTSVMSPKEHFQKCVPILMSMLYRKVGVNIDARNIVANILQQMFEKLVQKARQVTDYRSTLGAREIIKATDYFMPAVLAKYAISEGVRNAFIYLNGLSRYTVEDFAAKGYAVD
ncbi:hypothetical protein CDAR_536161 [Caerostris darwini]|uniref:Uncharacterized protein n=1 Tax=Caerostris darwini TaxID=1538125 RepID=A0AAV4V654_9ARAC|nr:hypothetical protein CDAR_536161 [Caerostris darwini]